jgi:hypothetical protein
MKKIATLKVFTIACLVLLFITTQVYSQQNVAVKNKNANTTDDTKIKNKMATEPIKGYVSVNGLKMYYEMKG